MEPPTGSSPRGRNILAASCTLGLLVAGALAVASSGSGTPGEPGVQTPVQADARATPTRLDGSSTSTTGERVDPIPAASPTGAAASETGASAPNGTRGDAPAGPTSPKVSAPTASALFILVCQGPSVIQDGIETSSQVVTRVPEGTPIPAGCFRG